MSVDEVYQMFGRNNVNLAPLSSESHGPRSDRAMSLPDWLRPVILTLAAVTQTPSQAIPIQIVDLYGLQRVPADHVRAALTVKEGDIVSLAGDTRPSFVNASEQRLAAVPGVIRARIHLVCCEHGGFIVYVGIEERDSATMSFRAAPTEDVRLAADIVQAGDEFSKALTLAVRQGDATEDRSQGHALNHNAAMRAVQERFIVYARRDLAQLRRVLRSSSSVPERALAAQVLGYAADKSAIVDELVYAMRDPAEEVRNNAVRALMVIAEMSPGKGTPVPRIPPQPFVALLNSPVWSDRNKAALALMALSASRDPAVLAAIRQPPAVAALAEMARWKSDGHAQPAYFILGRLAGYSEDRALDFWRRGEREVVINAAVARR